MTATEYQEASPGYGRVKTSLRPEDRDEPGNGPLSLFLGVFSIGLGLAELLDAPKVGARTGMPWRGVTRAYGLREIGVGLGILMSRRPAGWLWARVAGDALDLATLGVAYASVGEAGKRRALEAAGAVAGVMALDIAAACAHGDSA